MARLWATLHDKVETHVPQFNARPNNGVFIPICLLARIPGGGIMRAGRVMLGMGVAMLMGPGAVMVAAQAPDMAALQKWSTATAIHYEVVGEINDKHVMMPPKGGDLYGDVTDRVT